MSLPSELTQSIRPLNTMATILLTGGTGKTNIPLARLFSTTSDQAILLSRSGIVPKAIFAESGPNSVNNIYGVQFDWFDRSTWDAPFKFTEAHTFAPIDRVFLVGPVVPDYTFMNDYIDFARGKGVKRFVLLSASHTGSGDIGMGQTHKYLEELPAGCVEYVILRPTWFTENFGEIEFFASMIRDENKIYSISEDGKVPYISTQDIAEAAYKSLMDESITNGDLYIYGPELLNYDEVADLFSSILGWKVPHVRMEQEEYSQRCERLGHSMLAGPQLKIAQGSEEAIMECENAVMGKVTLKEYIEKNKDIWTKVSGRVD